MNVLKSRTILIAISGMGWLKCSVLSCPVFGKRRGAEAAGTESRRNASFSSNNSQGSPDLNGSSLPAGTFSSAMLSSMATVT